MQIKVLAFGIAKEILGNRQLSLELPDAASVEDLKDHLVQQFPEFDKLRSLSIAVNQNYVKDSQSLSPQDEVVIIPPVSGG